jgi:hypothetical protein
MGARRRIAGGILTPLARSVSPSSAVIRLPRLTFADDNGLLPGSASIQPRKR